MENNEVIIYDKEGKIINCNFVRVDLTTPASILSYGSEAIEAIGDVLDSTAQMAIETDQEIVEQKKIDSIENFGKELDESEKEQKSTSLIKKGKQLLANWGIKYFQESLEKESYKGRFEARCEMLDYIATAIEHQKQNTLNEIEFINGIIAEMLPLVGELELIIEVGKQDKDAFDKETEQMKQNMDSNDLDAQREIHFREKISEAFNEKLNKLANMLVAYKTQIDSYKMQQLVDYSIVADKEDYLRHSSPLLKAQGSLMVNNRIQAEKLEQSKALNQAVNNAITQNAKELLTNVQTAVDLSVNGGVQTSSLEVVTDALSKGIEVFKNGAKAKKDKIAKDEQSRKNIKNKLNTFNQELLNFVDSEFIEEKIIEGPTGQKRIGGK